MTSSEFLQSDCPVCSCNEAKRAQPGPIVIHCPVCGNFTYKLSERVDAEARQAHATLRAFLSTYVRERFEEARSEYGDNAYASIDWGEAFTWARSQGWNRPAPGSGPALSLTAAADLEVHLLSKLLKLRARGYSATLLRWSDYTLFRTDSAEAFDALLMHCARQGWLTCVPGIDPKSWHVSVTGAGETAAASQ